MPQQSPSLSRRFVPRRVVMVLAAAWILLAGAHSAFPEERTFSGKVVGVADGDTISVMREGRAVTVRLAGVDCPERGQAYGSQAKKLTSSMVFGRTVSVVVESTDRYGRLVGRVHAGREDVSLELIRAGYAWHYKQYSNDPMLRDAEEQARSARRGIWADSRPTPPWEFRRAAGETEQEASPVERQLGLGSEIGQRVEESLGLSPALAATPFCGLALLTGTALVTDTPWVRESKSPLLQRLRSNRLLAEMRQYSNWWLVLGLASLAAVTFLLNSGKVQGLAGKPLRLVESVGSLAIMAYLIANSGQGVYTNAHYSSVYVAGMFPTLGAAVFVTAGLMLVLTSMMFVRMALDLLIWLSPFPFVDLMFELLKKAFSLGFLVLFVVSPGLAALLAAVVCVIALLLLRWAARLVGFGLRVPLNPLLSKVLPCLRPTLKCEKWLRKVAVPSAECDIAVPASVWKSHRHRKRQPGVIVSVGGIPRFLTTTTLGRVQSTELRPPGSHLELGRALLWLELRAVDGEQHALERFALSYALLPLSQEICVHFGAADRGYFGPLGVIARVLRSLGHEADAETAVSSM